jgi:hypothetical protein
MSEFGLEMPMIQETKMGSDGKGPKGYIVQQNYMMTILGVAAVLMLLCGCQFAGARSQEASFTADLAEQREMAATQHAAKLEAETHLQQAAATLSEEVGKEKDEVRPYDNGAAHQVCPTHHTHKSPHNHRRHQPDCC